MNSDENIMNLFSHFLNRFDDNLDKNAPDYILFNKAKLSQLHGKKEEAIKLMTLAIEKNKGKNSLYFNERGNFYNDDEKFELALKDYDKALELEEGLNSNNPDISIYFSNRGHCNFYLKNFEQSIKDLDTALVLDSEDWYSLFTRGRVYFFLKKFDVAIDNINKGLSLMKDYDFGLYYRSLSYFCLKKYPEAMKDIEEAIAICLKTQKDLDNFQIKKNPSSNFYFHYRHTKAFLNIFIFKNYSEAFEDLRIAIEGNGDNSPNTSRTLCTHAYLTIITRYNKKLNNNKDPDDICRIALDVLKNNFSSDKRNKKYNQTIYALSLAEMKNFDKALFFMKDAKYFPDHYDFDLIWDQDEQIKLMEDRYFTFKMRNFKKDAKIKTFQ